MTKMTNSLVLGSVLAASTLVSGAAFAELTTNVGVTSNYLWRGVTQSGDDSAISATNPASMLAPGPPAWAAAASMNWTCMPVSPVRQAA